MKACVDMTTNMDELIAQNDRKIFAEGEELLSQAKELLQSLAGPSIDAVEIPQVRLERGQDWSLEGAVDLQLLQVQHNVCVCASQSFSFHPAHRSYCRIYVRNVFELSVHVRVYAACCKHN